jgi:hypothetical protein
VTEPIRTTICEQLAPDLAELSLGILPGRERSRLLAHLDSCRSCAATLEALSQTADALLEVAPALDPPIGFEVRVLGHLGDRPPGEPRLAGETPPSGAMRRPVRFHHQVGWAVAASVVALGAAFGAGWLAAPSSPATGPASASTPVGGSAAPARAVLQSPQGAWGKVLLYRGRPGWMFMTVSSGGWANAVTCEVTLADGSVVRIGTFALASGDGDWGAPLPVPVDQVRSARLVGPTGAVMATATFAA